jgi:predicted RNA-binding Zn-ribbon protein involved in translation (DUF1610 family)
VSALRWIRGLLERAKLALKVFRKGLPKHDREADKAVAEVISGQRKPGFPCPQCREPIVVGISALLAHGTVYCTKCGLPLKIDWKEDAKARQALENLRTVAAKVEESKRFKG